MEEPSINELSLADEIQKSSHHEVGSNWEANISDEKDLLPAPTATPPLQSDEVTETAAQLSDDVIVTAQTELQKEITTEKDLNDALTESNLNAEVTEVSRIRQRHCCNVNFSLVCFQNLCEKLKCIEYCIKATLLEKS